MEPASYWQAAQVSLPVVPQVQARVPVAPAPVVQVAEQPAVHVMVG